LHCLLIFLGLLGATPIGAGHDWSPAEFLRRLSKSAMSKASDALRSLLVLLHIFFREIYPKPEPKDMGRVGKGRRLCRHRVGR